MPLVQIIMLGGADPNQPTDESADLDLHMCGLAVDDSLLRDASWTELPTTTHLGLPLKIKRVNSTTIWNCPAAVLFIAHDSKCSTFGKIMLPVSHTNRAQDYLYGDFLLARVDGKDLSCDIVRYLLDYLFDAHARNGLTPFESRTGEEQEKTKAAMDKVVSPDAFAYHLYERRRQKVAAGDKLWKELELPVEKGKPVCATCCAPGGDGGKPLMICGTCKARHYCSKECQKGDWKAHKKVCAGRDPVKG